MAISGKEAARRIIDELPEDVTLEDIIHALGPRTTQTSHAQCSRATALDDIAGKPSSSANEGLQPVGRRLVRKGHITVIEATEPVPPLTAEIVNDLIDEMRREREARFLGLLEFDE